MLCGVSPSSAGYSYADDKGVRKGFDSDVCRAVSSAVFGAPDKVEFVPLNTNIRFQALQSGEIDVLSRQTTMTFSRDNSLGLDFGPVVFYDGQGLMVNAKLGVKSASELSQAAICLLPGTTTLQNLEDYFKPRGIKYESVVFEDNNEWRNAFFSGRCDVITTDRSDLASVRAVANDPKQFVILPETISKEPLAPVVRQNDSNWKDIVSWSVYTLIAAEEYGITQANVDEKLQSKEPEVQRMLGVHRRPRQDAEYRQQMGLQHHQAERELRRTVRAQPRREDAARPDARPQPALDQGRPALLASVPLSDAGP